MKRKRLFICIAIIFFITLIIGIIIKSLFPHFLDSFFSALSIIATLAGAFAVYIELRDTSQVSQGDFLMNLQDQYTSRKEFSDLFYMCWDYYNSKVPNIILIKYLTENKQALLNYLTFFETVYLIEQKKTVVTIETLDELFGRRFMVIVNNPIVQILDLGKNKAYYENVHSLYAMWREYREFKSNENYFCSTNFSQKKADLANWDNSFEIRILTSENESSLSHLIDRVEENIVDKTFWLPISETSRNHFFDKDWTIFFGLFENETLIGALGLFLNENEYGESQSHINMNDKKIAELGRAMILPNDKYRKKGLMKRLIIEAISYTIENNYKLELEYLLATIHPENLGSQQAFKAIGFEKKGEIIKSNGFIRDIMLLEIPK